MKRTAINASLLGACAAMSFATSALAVPQFVQSTETPSCDPLMNLTLVDELGLPNVFPFGERIDATASPTQLSACPTMDDPALPNALVRITNLNPFTFFNVHYVADPAAAGAAGTSISNEDGLVNAGQAFRIDQVGINRPLVSESMAPAGLFQPGETWTFIIQDYQNGLNLNPAAYTSIGVGAASAGPPSSGSIIALVVPEPGTLSLLGLAGVGLLARRRTAAAR
jgi:hypothetical protein